MIRKGKLAYTLAEIMIVLLILTIIFAAFAPLFTGRIQKTYKSKYNVWAWADYTGFNAFAAPTIAGSSGELIFGASPNNGDDITTLFAPLSRVIIRSGNITQDAVTQRQIQFRYGRTATTGSKPVGYFAGTWLVDGSNYLLGGSYKDLKESDTNKARYNTAVGYNALNSITTTTNNTAIGYDALSTLSTVSGTHNTAVGYMAGPKITGSRNTFIGSGAGSSSTSAKKNVAIGYNAMAKDTTGSNNTYIGYFAGYSNTGGNNVAIGYEAMKNLTYGSYNVAIGYRALLGLSTGSNNVAIGNYACSSVTGSNKTCIGYNSGPAIGRTSSFLKGYSDSTFRTYIGSPPHNYGGDAVLEIHNIATSNTGIPGVDTSPFNITTIVNGNLIVRGRPYFTVGQELHHFYDYDNSMKASGEDGIYYYGYVPGNSKYKKCASDSATYSFNSNCVILKTKPASTSSDRRLKNIEGKFTAGMDRLKDIKVYNYTFKNDKDKLPHVGVIAQELQKVFPTAVFKGEDGYLRIRWDEMFYAMINGIKEIDKRIIAIVKRTNNIEAQISQLEKENSILKTQVDNLTVRVNKLKAQ